VGLALRRQAGEDAWQEIEVGVGSGLSAGDEIDPSVKSDSCPQEASCTAV
jgi:hypothetical protein